MWVCFPSLEVWRCWRGSADRCPVSVFSVSLTGNEKMNAGFPASHIRSLQFLLNLQPQGQGCIHDSSSQLLVEGGQSIYQRLQWPWVQKWESVEEWWAGLCGLWWSVEKPLIHSVLFHSVSSRSQPWISRGFLKICEALSLLSCRSKIPEVCLGIAFSRRENAVCECVFTIQASDLPWFPFSQSSFIAPEHKGMKDKIWHLICKSTGNSGGSSLLKTEIILNHQCQYRWTAFVLTASSAHSSPFRADVTVFLHWERL